MLFIVIFFFKQKTAYEIRISDWSSDVCSSDLTTRNPVYRKRSHFLAVRKVRTGSRFIKWCDYLQRKIRGSSASSDFEPARNCWSIHSISSKIGRASCRERVCQYVSISVVAVSFKKKQQ